VAWRLETGRASSPTGVPLFGGVEAADGEYFAPRSGKAGDGPPAGGYRPTGDTFPPNGGPAWQRYRRGFKPPTGTVPVVARRTAWLGSVSQQHFSTAPGNPPPRHYTMVLLAGAGVGPNRLR